jgi:hypothetical protein
MGHKQTQLRMVFDGRNAGTGVPFIPGAFIWIPIDEPIPRPDCPPNGVLVFVSVLLPTGENDPSPTACGREFRKTEGTAFMGGIGLDLPVFPGFAFGGNVYREVAACIDRGLLLYRGGPTCGEAPGITLCGPVCHC